MQPERWRRIDDLFQRAAELPADRRPALLDAECGDDHDLRREVESLLRSDTRAGRFIETPAAAAVTGLFPEHAEESLLGRRLGPYRIGSEIGRGGMGAVYLAERADQQFTQRVAIKLIRRGMDSDDILRRFRAERQMLASLQHPNIARLLDGGLAPDGRPYLVMEFIEGLPIDEYCRSRELPVEQRLRLFQQVCAAVQHAHQHLVIHRDLKPANILVTADGTPKLLDFGIAKVLDQDRTASLTITARTERLLTPEYASPEQLRAESVTTATDIYSLGVILYELLAGRRPRGPEGALSASRDDEPDPPSTAVRSRAGAPTGGGATGEGTSDQADPRLARRLRGDLDNIALMALRVEPDRRYSSAEQLAQDIQRHLDGLPVQARPSTLRYRASKFVRRNKPLVAGALLTLVAFAAAAGISLGFAISAARARTAEAAHRAAAERRFQQVRKLAHTFMFDFYDSIGDLQGATPARELLVTTALEYLDSLAAEAGDDADLLAELAQAYARLADVQGEGNRSNLGDSAGSLRNHTRALQLRQAVLRIRPDDVQMLRDVGVSHSRIGDLLLAARRFPEASEHFRQAETIARHLADAAPDRAGASRDLAIARIKAGDAHITQGQRGPALQAYDQARELIGKLAAEDPAGLRPQLDLAGVHSRISRALANPFAPGDKGDLAGALDHERTALEISNRLLASNPNDAQVRRSVATGHVRIGSLLEAQRDLTGAAEHYEKYHRFAREAQEADPRDAIAAQDLALSLDRLARVDERAGRADDAASRYGAALDIRDALLQADPDSADLQRTVAVSCAQLARVLEQIGADHQRTVEDRLDAWDRARLMNQRSLDLNLQMKAAGTLRPSDEPMITTLEERVAACARARNELRPDD